MSYTAAQNTLFFTTASVLQKVISSIYFIIIARFIGVDNTGEYFTVLTSIAIFTVIADFGFGAVLTRESAAFPEHANNFLHTIFIAKLGCATLAIGLLALAKIIFNYPPQAWLLVAVAGATLFLDSLQNTFYGVLRSRRNLLFESIGIIGAQAGTLIIGTFAIIYKLPLIWLIAAYMVPSFLSNIYGATMLFRQTGIRPRLQFNPDIFKHFLRLAWPFALAGVLMRLYSYSDSLLLLKYLGNRELGWWSIAYKVVYAFQFVPLALTAVMYPTMSAALGQGTQHVARLYARSVQYLLIVGLPLSIGLMALAKPFVSGIYGQSFLPSVPALIILSASLMFGFLALLSGSTLNALGKQTTQTSLLAAAVITSILLNVLFIPRQGIVGAASVALITNTLLCLAGIICIHRYIELPGKNLLFYGVQVLFPALAMGIVALYLATMLHFILAAIVAGAAYIALLFFTGALTTELIFEIKAVVFKRNARSHRLG